MINHHPFQASPVWAVSSTIVPSNPSISYEQELKAAILKRSGKTEVLPPLTDIPGEKVCMSLVTMCAYMVCRPSLVPSIR